MMAKNIRRLQNTQRLFGEDEESTKHTAWDNTGDDLGVAPAPLAQGSATCGSPDVHGLQIPSAPGDSPDQSEEPQVADSCSSCSAASEPFVLCRYETCGPLLGTLTLKQVPLAMSPFCLSMGFEGISH
uniref:Uncharacterized protein n=1 Tax=Sphaerodactylus townsendi TaxID=933632 RepID=A0ACB8FWC3_9SAUR